MGIEEQGYLFTYLSDEGEVNMDVYFDDYSVELVAGPVVQIDDYYPYGMSFQQEVSEHELLNRYGFQGKELVEETGWYDFRARQYSPALGRFLAVDPAGQFASPYVGMGNNPVVGVDPDGEFVILAVAALVGGALNVWSNADKIKGVGSFFAYFGSGAIGGAVSVASPALGGSLTTGLNVGIDVVIANLPDFNDPADVATYVGFKAVEGFGTAGVGKMTKAGLNGLKSLGNGSAWLQSFSMSGKTVGSITKGYVLPEVTLTLTKVPASQLAANAARLAAKGGV